MYLVAFCLHFGLFDKKVCYFSLFSVSYTFFLLILYHRLEGVLCESSQLALAIYNIIVLELIFLPLIYTFDRDQYEVISFFLSFFLSLSFFLTPSPGTYNSLNFTTHVSWIYHYFFDFLAQILVGCHASRSKYYVEIVHKDKYTSLCFFSYGRLILSVQKEKKNILKK